MKLNEFDKFLAEVLQKINNVLGSKSADYSDGGDKLYNFKLQARIDGITPVESLRGNHLKHRASVCQGLDELQQGKIRPYDWWQEKTIDDINYLILQLALLKETYFED